VVGAIISTRLLWRASSLLPSRISQNFAVSKQVMGQISLLLTASMVDAKDQETCQVKINLKKTCPNFLCSVCRQPLSGARTGSQPFPGSSKMEEIFFLNGSTHPLKI
jgi:hypothetical protein